MLPDRAWVSAIAGAPSISVIDVLPGSSPEARDALVAVHRQNFGVGYLHAVNDLDRAWRDGSLEADIIEHQWLVLLDDVPSGEFIFHTNLRRRMVVRHFLAMNREARPALPSGWIPALVAAVGECASRDAADSGIELVAMMSEVNQRHVSGWRRLGHLSPNIDYREPVHGNHWAEWGEPQFIPMSANVLLLPGSEGLPLGEVVAEGASAFLLDYYRLPPSHEVVVEILSNCARLE